MSKRITALQQNIAHLLDENQHTRRWQKQVDYLIIFMIILSTLEIFISTFDIGNELKDFLIGVDDITLAFFTIEVSLRIWIAPCIHPKYKGWKGRIKYCCTFYGAIDFWSTFPFFLQWFLPLPVRAFKVLRILRVLRILKITRYTKSWELLYKGINEKKSELWISMQFLLLITLILSIMLYYAEHDAQPSVYNNGMVSTLWAFAQYIGDPGSFAETPPITFAGRAIACIVGLLGIAIVAVPTGIIGSGFTEAIAKEKNKKYISEIQKTLKDAFASRRDKVSGYQIIPPYKAIGFLKSRMGVSEPDIIEAVRKSKNFRLVDLSTTIPSDVFVNDRLAIEYFPQNRPYGCLIDRNSPITIIAPSSLIDACTANFSFYLSYFGGFNYVSREIGTKIPYNSFHVIMDQEQKGLKEYRADIEKLMSRNKAWSFSILCASGANEPVFPTQIHLSIGGPKEDARMGGAEDLTVQDSPTYNRFYNNLMEIMKTKFDLLVDHQKYYSGTGKHLFARVFNLPKDSNNVVVRIEWNKMLWDSRRILIAQTLAQTIENNILDEPRPDTGSHLKTKYFEYEALMKKQESNS